MKIVFLQGDGAKLPTPQMWVTHNNFPPKNTKWKRERKSTFIVENPDKHYLSQMIKVNIISDKSR